MTIEHAETILWNVAGLMALAFIVGFWLGERSESKFRDRLDKLAGRSGRGK